MTRKIRTYRVSFCIFQVKKGVPKPNNLFRLSLSINYLDISTPSLKIFRDYSHFKSSPNSPRESVFSASTSNCEKSKSDIRSFFTWSTDCLLYTSDAADDLLCVDLGGR